MTHQFKFVVCFTATLCAQVGFSQVSPTQVDSSVSAAASKSPVAYVYVTSKSTNNKNEINAFAASANGKLTRVAGSPFSADVQKMAVNAKYVFGTNGVTIYSYGIEANGALREVASIDAQKFNQADCGGPIGLFLDRSGSTLYDVDIYSDCSNNAFQFFGSEGSTGGLSYRGTTAASSPEFYLPLSFLGNNEYAYGSSCYHFGPTIYGFARGSDGSLTHLGANPTLPAASTGNFYCPYLADTDTTNHVAVPVQPLSGFSWQPAGAYQLATYTADNSGNLTTNSTYSNMPTTLAATGTANSLTDVAMSPSGKLLAVAGNGGLQVFHFNGANPVTHYTGLLYAAQVDQLFWDNDNHLYALSQTAGKLFVFTVTPTNYKQAPGSPYTITSPEYIAVSAR
jgi:WD40 repeat protein